MPTRATSGRVKVTHGMGPGSNREGRILVLLDRAFWVATKAIRAAVWVKGIRR